jgi:hypothetical protein
MDEVYKNCCWFCLAESSKTKPTKIEKNGCPALKKFLLSSPTPEYSREFQNFLERI